MLTFDYSIMTSTNILLFILIVLIIFLILYFVKNDAQLKQIIKKQNEENLQRVQELKNQIKDFGLSRYLDKALNKNLKNFSEKKIALLEEQYHKIMNSYKILYFRKISNLILDCLFKNHGAKFSKTEAIFLNDEKPELKKKKFPIICVSKSFDKILNVDKYLINLIIDFLMYMKDFTSAIIHLSEFSYSFQIEILSQYIGHKVEKSNNKYYINTEELINLLFQQDNTNNKIGEEPIIKKNLNINNIDNIDNKIDNNIDNSHEISTTLKNNIILNNMREPEEYSTEISENGKSLNGNSHYNQNAKSDFVKVGQRNIEKENSNNNNNEKNINQKLNETLNKVDIAIKDKNFINNQKSSISETSKTSKIKINKSEDNKINKEKDKIIITEEEEEENDEDENLKRKKKNNKKGKKNDIKKEDKKEKVQKEEKKIKKDADGKENKEVVKKNGEKKENEGDGGQRKDTEEKRDEDKNKIKKEPKNNCEKKEDEIQKEHIVSKNNIFNDNLNQDLSENEVDIDTLKKFDNLILRLGGNDKKQNLNQILNNENNSHENVKSYSYDIKEMEIVLFKDDFQFKDDKVEVIKEIKEYVIKISQIKSNKMNDIIKIDTNYIFNSWFNTFGKGYKKNELFKKLVQINRYPDLNIDKFKKALLLLIPDQNFEILSEDPSRFDMMIKNIIKLKESETY